MTHPQDSHTYLDPYEAWCRTMRIHISREAWNNLQRGHFTYWYMPQPVKVKGEMR